MSQFRLMLFVLFTLSCVSFAQVKNGKLQIHHIDVGQADGAVLISPNGEVVIFDLGEDMKRKTCKPVLAYLDQLGIKSINYVFVSHYHFDHIGCIPAALKEFPLAPSAVVYDRGFDYNGATFNAYAAAVSGHRRTAKVGDVVLLDKDSANPVKIRVFAVDGQSVSGTTATSNENDLSLGAVISFGAFTEEISGDLSGDNTNMYQDVETPAAKDVGPIEVYKVHHHCSSHSTNGAWLDATRPTIAIISTGDGNGYGHPTADCLTRLHESGLQKVYWTEEGAGTAKPDADSDAVAGDIQIQVSPGAASYTVTSKEAATAQYSTRSSVSSSPSSPSGGNPVANHPKYAWSKRSSKYHDAACPDVNKILAENLVQGNDPPADKVSADCVKTH